MGGDEASGGTTGTDAERRLALDLAARLRAGGREARVQPLWVRPAWWLVQAACAAAGVVASVLAVGSALAGVIVAGVALVLAIGDLTRMPLLRRLTPARASQNVVSPPPPRPGARPVTLIVTAPVDRPRQGLERRLGLPLLALSIASLALVAGCAGVRLAGVGDGWIGAVQLVPTIVLLVAVAGFLDQGVAAPVGDDRAPQAAVELVHRLDAAPPRNLDVAVVLAGAGSAHAAGLRRWLDGRRRRGRRPQDVALLDLESWPPAGEGVVWWRRNGLVLAAALHPQLCAAAQAAAMDLPEPARTRSAPDATGAGVARGRGWPAIAVGVGDERRRCVDFALDLVRQLDAQLGLDAPPVRGVESRVEA